MRFLRDARGATAAEFAMVLPIFTLMVLGAVQFGLAQHKAGGMNFALEKAARSVMLNPAMTQSAVQAAVTANLDTETAAKTVVSYAVETGGAAGNLGRVTGVYTSQIGLPGLAALPFSFTRTVVTPLAP